METLYQLSYTGVGVCTAAVAARWRQTLVRAAPAVTGRGGCGLSAAPRGDVDARHDAEETELRSGHRPRGQRLAPMGEGGWTRTSVPGSSTLGNGLHTALPVELHLRQPEPDVLDVELPPLPVGLGTRRGGGSASRATSSGASARPLRARSRIVEAKGFEPSTSCLQSRCSTGLSYAPWWWRRPVSNRRPSACEADALPSELHPHRPQGPHHSCWAAVPEPRGALRGCVGCRSGTRTRDFLGVNEALRHLS